jgi:Fur family transcriptional regulator, peroxide stress response regulator
MGERRTPQLEATYAVVRAARDHPTAEEIHARVRRHIAHISLGTVYRNLRKLAAQGRIRVVQLAPGHARFDGMLDRHEHFVCDTCGRITDLPSVPRMSPDSVRLNEVGYEVTHHTTTFFGSCPSCRGTKRRGRRR